GVAMKSNLHNVLFQPATTKFWVANAAADGSPAAEQKYYAFQLSELLARNPDPGSEDLAATKRVAKAVAAE
ncbi:MAG: peptidase C45, partial [Planctomycetales bacterium]|nr:peptidase C45 [Planctomycetales bacterium]